MQQSTPLTKKRWVDYSSDGTSSLVSSDMTFENNTQLEKLKKMNPIPQMIWLQVDCSRARQSEKKIVKQLRNDKLKISVFDSRQINGFDIKVYTKEAENYLKNKIPGTNNLKIKFSQRNYWRQPSRDSKDRNQQKSGHKNSHGKSQGKNSRNKHNLYVDKQTGEKPDNKKKYDERVIEQNQRKYTKKQTNLLGDQLANFRSKQKKENIKKQEQKAPSPFNKNTNSRWDSGKSSKPKQKIVQKWKMKNPFEDMAQSSENDDTPQQAPFVKKMSPLMTSLKREESKKSLSKNQIISQRSTQTQNSQKVLKGDCNAKSTKKRTSKSKSKYKPKN